MLLKLFRSKDYLFYGTDEELCKLFLRDLSLHRKVLILGTVPQEERVKSINYIANEPMKKRVRNIFDYSGTVSPYGILYDLSNTWPSSAFINTADYFMGSRQSTIRVRRVTKEELTEVLQVPNYINWHIKRTEEFIYK